MTQEHQALPGAGHGDSLAEVPPGSAGPAGQEWARQERARQEKANGGKASRGKASRGKASRGKASRGKASRGDPVAWLIALVAFGAYTTISVARYLRLDPGSWDLGIFTEYVRQVAHLRAPVVSIRGAGFDLLGDHFQPIVALIAPFFRIFPTPVTLLAAQALLTAVSVVPVCRAAQVLLGTWPSRAVGAAYGFSWGLQQMINFDFHEIAFAVPLLACSLSALVRRRLRGTVLWTLPLVLVKEDQGFTVAAIGLVMVAMGLAASARGRHEGGQPQPVPAQQDHVPMGPAQTGPAQPGLPAQPGVPPQEPARQEPARQEPARHNYPQAGLARRGPALPGPPPVPVAPAAASAWGWAGVLLTVWGLAWSVVAIAVIIPHFNPSHQYEYWKNGGVIGPGGHLALSSMVHQLAVAGTQKLWTTAMALLPVAFLALGSPLSLIAVPSLLLRFVSTNSYFWGTDWHYDATVMPIVFLAAIDTMARLRARASQRAVRAEAAAGRARRWRSPGLLVARYGAVAMVVIAGWLAFRFPLASLWNRQTYTTGPHVSAEQAAMARVPAGTTVEATLSMLATLAARDDTFWIGNGGNPAPRYIVFDETNSGWYPPPKNALAFVDQRHPGDSYRTVFEDDGVYVFREFRPSARRRPAAG